jgi:phosphoribosylglycinamide formyltransferase-1
VVVSDRREALALKRARQAGIRGIYINPESFPNKESFDREIIRHLQKAKVEFVVLAGYMRILSPHFIYTYRNKIINVHPSLLPAFQGRHAIQDAFLHGVKVTGVTVHFVIEQVDHGPIIAQEAVEIRKNDTEASLEKRIHAVEHRLYPKVVDWLVRGKLKIVGRKVMVRS